jgi:hypothetical protein
MELKYAQNSIVKLPENGLVYPLLGYTLEFVPSKLIDAVPYFFTLVLSLAFPLIDHVAGLIAESVMVVELLVPSPWSNVPTLKESTESEEP